MLGIQLLKISYFATIYIHPGFVTKQNTQVSNEGGNDGVNDGVFEGLNTADVNTAGREPV